MQFKFQSITSAYRTPEPGDSENLPIDIGFLRRYGVGRAQLQRASVEARELGTNAPDVLIAQGVVSAARYYLCLADTLGVPFIAAGALLERIDDPGPAIRHGFSRVAQHSAGSQPASAIGTPQWLMAPQRLGQSRLQSLRQTRG